MSDPALRRTIRRCTAVLVLVFATFMVMFQKFMGNQGIPTDSNPSSELFFAVAGIYLIGSLGWSLFKRDE